MAHNKYSAKATIMLVVHQLEKGLSLSQSSKARIFGADKAKYLVELVKDYESKYGIDEECIIAINVLNEYLKSPLSTPDIDLRILIENYIKANSQLIKDNFVGVKTVSKPPVFEYRKIEEFFSSRSSVREFSDKPVSDNEIKRALQIAAYTPSACNRQASRVHVYRDKKQMERIINVQLGNQNWCQNADTLFVVSVNNSYFGGGTNAYKPLSTVVCTQ